jgi:hypothetical protein
LEEEEYDEEEETDDAEESCDPLCAAAAWR